MRRWMKSDTEKIQAQRGNQRWKGGGGRESGKPCWFSSFRGGARRERRERKEEAEQDRGEEVRD